MAADETRSTRWTGLLAVVLLQLGALAVVVVAAPYKAFDLDRFFVPKELVLAGTACVAGIVCMVRAAEVRFSRVDKALALSLVIGALSAVLSTNVWLAERSLAVTAGGIMCFWCARLLAREGHGRALVAALAIAGIAGALTSLLQAYGMRVDWFSLNRAPGGTFGNRNFMAHLSVITLPALFYSAAVSRSRGALLRWSAGSAIIGAALILSRTRAAWLALVMGLAVFALGALWALRRRDGSVRAVAFGGLIAAGALGASLALVIPNTLDWRSDNPYMETAQGLVNYKAGSGRGRLVQYRNSLRMTVRHPLLGVGPGNWAVIYPRFASVNDPSLGSDGMTSNPWPSSDWVAFLSERGVIALLALVTAFVLLARDGLRSLHDGESADTRLASAALVATLVTVLTVGAFDAVTVLAAPALIAWSLLGALAPISRDERLRTLTVGERLLGATLVAVVFGAASTRSALELAAMQLYGSSSRLAVLEHASALDPGNFRMHVRLAEGYENRGSCTKARPHALAARALFPSSPIARRLAAACAR